MKRSLPISLFSAFLVAGAAVAPVANALATPVQYTSHNAAVSHSTGPYDGLDAYRDETGRPLPGWQNLFFSPAA